MQIEKIAMVAHQVNRALCEAYGDFSQVDWSIIPDWQRHSALDGVTYHMSTIDSSPRESHENWMKFKLEDGWKFGHSKSEVLKTHPCLVSYDYLPVEQKAKDFIFKAVVEALEDL